MDDSKRSPNFDDLLNDLFGLNIRALKTIKTAFINPRALYEAAQTPDWNDTYTPSFRVWFTLMAFTLFFQFFWAGADTVMISQATEQFKATGMTFQDGVTAEDAALLLSKWTFAALPFAYAFSAFLFASIYRVWGQKLTYVERQRFIFISILPNTTFSFFALFAMAFASPAYYPLVTALSIAGMFVLDFITTFRGAFPKDKNRLLRALAFVVFSMFIVLFVNIICSVFAGFMISQKFA